MYCTSSHDEYMLKDTEELLDYAICPQCAMGMVLTKEHPIGIDPGSVNIIKLTCRGI